MLTKHFRISQVARSLVTAMSTMNVEFNKKKTEIDLLWLELSLVVFSSFTPKGMEVNRN